MMPLPKLPEMQFRQLELRMAWMNADHETVAKAICHEHFRIIDEYARMNDFVHQQQEYVRELRAARAKSESRAMELERLLGLVLFSGIGRTKYGIEELRTGVYAAYYEGSEIGKIIWSDSDGAYLATPITKKRRKPFPSLLLAWMFLIERWPGIKARSVKILKELSE